ncbi:prephenate dehydratase [Pontivivens insulae]|uniref:prephenate dehydratase n=1 Tax=Pontivivens insulae TaxID=1639689 RepID=A0A2R8ADK7_9RHOB|nr:prephenate dehydratase [Pontivivens insulae]RED14239.1 prephenate dehydratase [Pontivivens insulae]SPF30314.1 P-protein [Pontivivens insulae]
MDRTGTISFQGELGAYSHQACREMFPHMEPLPCRTFEEAIAAVRERRADLGMIAVENSTYGRVADVHQLLPGSGLHIVGEHFVRVNINLWGAPGAKISDVREAMSHTVLLGQCRPFLQEHGIKPIVGADTAGSAREVAEGGNPARAALASDLAGEIYGLDLLAQHIEENKTNTTRFLVMAPDGVMPEASSRPMMTSFLFRVRNIPAALYKAMGGFATNGVNMTKLESYMLDASFTATQFFAEVDGHPDDPAVARALEELDYFCSELRILGVYPKSSYRV